jgi:hypothetical protein
MCPARDAKDWKLGGDQKFAHGFEAAVAYTLLNARFTQSFNTVTGTPSVAVNVPAWQQLPGIAGNNLFGELGGVMR